MAPVRILGILALLTVAANAIAEPAPPVLSFPVDCDIGRSCSLQKYVDHDSGHGYRDYRCGPLASNRHDGTDMRAAAIPFPCTTAAYGNWRIVPARCHARAASNFSSCHTKRKIRFPSVGTAPGSR